MTHPRHRPLFRFLVVFVSASFLCSFYCRVSGHDWCQWSFYVYYFRRCNFPPLITIKRTECSPVAFSAHKSDFYLNVASKLCCFLIFIKNSKRNVRTSTMFVELSSKRDTDLHENAQVLTKTHTHIRGWSEKFPTST